MTRLLPPINLHIRSRQWAWLSSWRSLRLVMLGLALSLVFSQSLGQLHAIKHAVKHGGHASHEVHVGHEGHEANQANEANLQTHEHPGDHGFLEQLFSSHGSDSDCRLYDQLSSSHAMPAVALAIVPVVMPSLLVAIFQGEALARWAALFDARGPPLTF